MNTKHLCLVVAASGLLLGPKHLLAQDKPADAKPPEQASPPPGPKPPSPEGDKAGPKPDFDHRDGEHGHRHHDGDHRSPEMKAMPYIGVMTRPLSADVRAQTGLQDGFGLIVEDVMPESPAKTADLKQHDVLVLLGDQRLVNVEQLAVLVRSYPKDSEVVFTIKRAGAEQKVTVKVGEKMMPVVPEFDGPHWPGMHPNGGEFRQNMEHFQQGMRDFQDKVQDWARGPRDRGAPQSPPQGRDQRGPGGESRPHHGLQDQGPRPGGDKGPGGNDHPAPPQGNATPATGDQGSTQSSVSVLVDGTDGSSVVSTTNNLQRNVTRRDKTGEYSLRQEGEDKVFTVKPVDGTEQTFTVTTDDQRKAVPADLQIKLQELDEVSKQVKIETKQPSAETPEGRSSI